MVISIPAIKKYPSSAKKQPLFQRPAIKAQPTPSQVVFGCNASDFPQFQGIPHGLKTLSTKSANKIRFGVSKDDYKGPPVFISPDYLGEFLRVHNGQVPQTENLEHQLMISEFQRVLNAKESSASRRDPMRVFLKYNNIPVYGAVHDGMANEIRTRAQLLVSAMKKTGIKKPIRFLVNSPGGSIYSLYSIMDTMDALKKAGITVETYCVGMAASAASVIMANGSQGHRYMTPRSTIMIHQPLSGTQGPVSNMERDLNRAKKMKEELTQFYEQTTKMPPKKLREVLEIDYYMDSEESLQYGFVDKIASQFPVLELKSEDSESICALGKEKPSEDPNQTEQ